MHVDAATPLLDEESPRESISEEGVVEKGELLPCKFPNVDDAPGSDANILQKELRNMPRGKSIAAVSLYLATAAYVGVNLVHSEQRSVIPKSWILDSSIQREEAVLSNLFPLVFAAVWVLALRGLARFGGARDVSVRARRCVVAAIASFLATILLSFLVAELGYQIDDYFIPCFFDCFPDAAVVIFVFISAYTFYLILRSFIRFMGRALHRLQVSQEDGMDSNEGNAEDRRLLAHGTCQEGENQRRRSLAIRYHRTLIGCISVLSILAASGTACIWIHFLWKSTPRTEDLIAHIWINRTGTKDLGEH